MWPTLNLYVIIHHKPRDVCITFHILTRFSFLFHVTMNHRHIFPARRRRRRWRNLKLKAINFIQAYHHQIMRLQLEKSWFFYLTKNLPFNMPSESWMTMGIFLCFISRVWNPWNLCFLSSVFLCCCCLLILFLLFLLFHSPLCMHTYRKNWVYQSRQHHQNKIFVNVVCICICSKNLIKIPFHTGPHTSMKESERHRHKLNILFLCIDALHTR